MRIVQSRRSTDVQWQTRGEQGKSELIGMPVGTSTHHFYEPCTIRASGYAFSHEEEFSLFNCDG